MGEKAEPGSGKAHLYITKVIGGQVFHSKMLLTANAATEILKGAGFCLTGDGESSFRYAGKGRVGCPSCGQHRKDFETTGRFGCPECYRAFGDLMPAMLRRMHRGTEHLGKIPAAAVTEGQLLRRRTVLKDWLDRSVSREEYEEAAAFRDDLRELEDRVRDRKDSEGVKSRGSAVEAG